MFVFKQITDDTNKKLKLEGDNSPPKIVIEGALPKPNKLSIVGEGVLMLQMDGESNFISAIKYLMLFYYYILNLQYPQSNYNTYMFLQREVLGIADSAKVPPKVINLITELRT